MKTATFISAAGPQDKIAGKLDSLRIFLGNFKKLVFWEIFKDDLGTNRCSKANNAIFRD